MRLRLTSEVCAVFRVGAKRWIVDFEVLRLVGERAGEDVEVDDQLLEVALAPGEGAEGAAGAGDQRARGRAGLVPRNALVTWAP